MTEHMQENSNCTYKEANNQHKPVGQRATLNIYSCTDSCYSTKFWYHWYSNSLGKDLNSDIVLALGSVHHNCSGAAAFRKVVACVYVSNRTGV